MSITLYLAEKPSMGRVIADALLLNDPNCSITEKTNNYIKSESWAVSWLAGHAYQLYDAKDYHQEWQKRWEDLPLPLIPETFKFKPIEGEYINNCRVHTRNLLDQAKIVVLATDSGQEGQVIGEIFLQENNWRGETLRLWTSSTEPPAIAKALKRLKSNNDPLYQGLKKSGMARTQMDWLIGINLSIAYTNIANKAGYSFLASCGRVQSCLLAIIVDHEKMINEFQHKGYFDAKATLTNQEGELIEASIKLPENLLNEDGHCTNEDALREIIANCSKSSPSVKHIQNKTVNHKQPMPFDFTALCIMMSKKYGIPSAETASLYQKMYEQGILTYTRTEDAYYQDEQLDSIEKLFFMLKNIDSEFSAAISGADLTLNPSCFNSSKIVEHPANSATTVPPDWGKMTDKSKNIYREVANRMIIQFYPEFIVSNSTIVIDVGGYDFITKGRQTIQEGWTLVTKPDASNEDSDDTRPLPKMEQGEQLKLVSIDLLTKKTRAPSRITEAALLGIMKDANKYLVSEKTKASLKEPATLGSAATRSGYVKFLTETRKFVNINGSGVLAPTKLGKIVRSIIPIELASPDLSALWEIHFRSIRKSLLDPDDLINQTKQWVTQQIKTAKNLKIKTNPLCFPCTKEQCKSVMKRIEIKDTKRTLWVCTDSACNNKLADYNGKPLENLAGHGEACSNCGEPMTTKIRNKTKMSLPDIRKTKEFRFLSCKNNHYMNSIK